MTDEEFDAGLQRQVDFVREELIGRARVKYVAAMLHIHGEDPAQPGKTSILVGFEDMPERAEARHAIFRALGAKLRAEGFHVEAVWFTMEAHTRTYRLDAEERPAGPPLCDEVILLAGMTADGRHNMAIVHIDRTVGGQLLWGGAEFHGCAGPGERKQAPLLEAFFAGWAAE